jgi:hypothetical protein
VVRSLLRDEGFPPARIIVVVNGSGGLDDEDLERSVQMHRLSTNTGPAGGFREGLLAAFQEADTNWAYLCEDDVGLFELPTPRVERVLKTVEASAEPAVAGAVVAYGRYFVGRGHSINVEPPRDSAALVPVDVAAWGATLVSREVVTRGVLPAADWFFGFEDFDFFCRVRDAGMAVLLDTQAAGAAKGVRSAEGREAAIELERPTDSDEPWRAYYVARNFVHLARAHGTPSWLAWHVAYSARRLQLSKSSFERRAIAHGLLDGLRGRLGPNARYLRELGENPSSAASFH